MPPLIKGGSLVMSENKFEKKELSQEILQEWYDEKENQVDFQEERVVAPPPVFVLPDEKVEVEDGNKKEIIKNEIRNLLILAEKNGLESSIKEARRRNDAFLLDVYHDVLAEDKKYKKIIGK